MPAPPGRNIIAYLNTEDLVISRIEIHRLIVRCSDCLLLQEELDRLLLIERTAVALNTPPEDLQSYQHSHQALVQAIADRDADSAEYAMKKHVRTGYRDVLTARGQSPPSYYT